jgi:hypothetical protein
MFGKIGILVELPFLFIYSFCRKYSARISSIFAKPQNVSGHCKNDQQNLNGDKIEKQK